ncbi:MAG: WD40 repeat domain-containing protein, partial [Vicinamibacteria bacterium]
MRLRYGPVMRAKLFALLASVLGAAAPSDVAPPRVLAGHAKGVNAVAFSRDGRILASGSADTTVKLWDLAAGTALRTLRGHDEAVRSVAFSPDGSFLASGSYDSLRLWDASSGKGRDLSGAPKKINGVAFSPDNRLLAAGGGDGIVTLWDVATGKAAGQIRGHAPT